MLFALALLLFALWVLGMMTSTMLSGGIHLFLLFSIVAVIARLIQIERAR